MVDPMRSYFAGAHRCEIVAEINGVQYINDAKCTNVDALRKSLMSARAKSAAEPNVWLIAGGRNKGLEFHDVGPLLSQRVKQGLVFGEASEKIRAAWSLFTPCKVFESLVEAVNEAAKLASAGDVVLFSPACSSLDQFRNYQQRGEIFCETVKSISRGASGETPNAMGKSEEPLK